MPIQVPMSLFHPWCVALVAMSLYWGCEATGAVPAVDPPIVIDEATVDKFAAFLRAYGKAYSDKHTFDQRLKIYAQNSAFIDAFNMNRPSGNLRLGINQFADLTKNEFKQLYLSSLPKDVPQTGGSFNANFHQLPDNVDWRTKGAVTPVKDQKTCGSCWAFSTTGAIEGAWFLINGSLISLSEEELVDCSGGSCHGGKPVTALKWVAKHGICTEKSYPYTAYGDECHNQWWPCEKAARISGYSAVQSNNEAALKAAVAQQPISVCIEADSDIFRFYKSGVLKGSGCGYLLDHAVLAVGYGTEEKQDYWLVKNSWNVSWGEHGYVKIARTDSTASAGECGIAMQPVFPVIENVRVLV